METEELDLPTDSPLRARRAKPSLRTQGAGRPTRKRRKPASSRPRAASKASEAEEEVGEDGSVADAAADAAQDGQSSADALAGTLGIGAAEQDPWEGLDAEVSAGMAAAERQRAEARLLLGAWARVNGRLPVWIPFERLSPAWRAELALLAADNTELAVRMPSALFSSREAKSSAAAALEDVLSGRALVDFSALDLEDAWSIWALLDTAKHADITLRRQLLSTIFFMAKTRDRREALDTLALVAKFRAQLGERVAGQFCALVTEILVDAAPLALAPPVPTSIEPDVAAAKSGLGEAQVAWSGYMRRLVYEIALPAMDWTRHLRTLDAQRPEPARATEHQMALARARAAIGWPSFVAIVRQLVAGCHRARHAQSLETFRLQVAAAPDARRAAELECAAIRARQGKLTPKLLNAVANYMDENLRMRIENLYQARPQQSQLLLLRRAEHEFLEIIPQGAPLPDFLLGLLLHALEQVDQARLKRPKQQSESERAEVLRPYYAFVDAIFYLARCGPLVSPAPPRPVVTLSLAASAMAAEPSHHPARAAGSVGVCESKSKVKFALSPRGPASAAKSSNELRADEGLVLARPRLPTVVSQSVPAGNGMGAERSPSEPMMLDLEDASPALPAAPLPLRTSKHTKRREVDSEDAAPSVARREHARPRAAQPRRMPPRTGAVLLDLEPALPEPSSGTELLGRASQTDALALPPNALLPDVDLHTERLSSDASASRRAQPASLDEMLPDLADPPLPLLDLADDPLAIGPSDLTLPLDT